MAKHHGMKHHDGKHHGKHHEEEKEHERKKGGRVGMWVSGNPDVKEEAEDDEDGAETGHERKHGGKVKKHKKHHRATGGKVLGLMTGGGVRARLDRPGRKSGGAVGANRSPLSTAHGGGHGPEGSSSPTDTYGGTPK